MDDCAGRRDGIPPPSFVADEAADETTDGAHDGEGWRCRSQASGADATIFSRGGCSLVPPWSSASPAGSACAPPLGRILALILDAVLAAEFRSLAGLSLPGRRRAIPFLAAAGPFPAVATEGAPEKTDASSHPPASVRADGAPRTSRLSNARSATGPRPRSSSRSRSLAPSGRDAPASNSSVPTDVPASERS